MSSKVDEANSEAVQEYINTALKASNPPSTPVANPDPFEAGQTNIMVAVRSRPLSKKEHGHNLVKVSKSTIVNLLDPYADQQIPEEVFRINRSKEKQYAFDYAFSETAAQQEIFDKTTAPLLNGVINGFNATVFAYGATGAGKTYTMLGTLEHPGIMILTLHELFTFVQGQLHEREFSIKLSYIEIYNEMIKDLINVTNEVLDIREDPVKGIVVAGLSEMLVTSPDEVMQTMRRADQNRTVEPTQANETSSRSHAVLQITVEHCQRESEQEIYQGKLSLIDLAGSERASNTQNRGIRLIEGASINRSLLALGNCINALVEVHKGVGKIHIPYRDSKLTRLLKDSLGGNCRTVMIACISPFINAYEDTHNTLKYANRAKNIKTHAKPNVIKNQTPIKKYTGVISRLKSEITELRGRIKTNAAAAKNKTPAKRAATQEVAIPPAPLSPSQEVDKCLIEITRHFAKEAETRKRLHEVDAKIQQLGFIIYQRQMEFHAKTKSGDSGITQLTEELEILKNTMQQHNATIASTMDKITECERIRDAIPGSWKKRGITEPYLGQLELEFRKHVLTMEKIDLTRQESNKAFQIKQKEVYIENLEKQMKVRDQLISRQVNVIRTNHIEIDDTDLRQELQPLEECNSAAKLILPDIYRGQHGVSKGAEDVLMTLERYRTTSQSPEESPRTERSRQVEILVSPETRIPKPKPKLMRYGSQPFVSRSIQQPMRQLQSYRVLPVTKKPRPVSSGSDKSNQSTQTSGIQQKGPFNVAIKYQNSVYNRPRPAEKKPKQSSVQTGKMIMRKDSLVIRDPVQKKRRRINPQDVKYGEAIRAPKRY